MKSQYAIELVEGMHVDAVFAMRAKELRSTRAGEAYLALELADRTGLIPAVFFRPSADSISLPTGSVVEVRGTVTTYRGTRRVSIDSVRPAGSYERADLLAAGSRPTSELVSELRELVGGVRVRTYRGLLRAVFGDKEFFARFSECPGSQSYHHAHLSGLLEHTVSVARLARVLAGMYAQVDKDLLVTAALLHDLGKVEELGFDTGVEYTDEGRLLGHVVLGMQRVRSTAERVGLSREQTLGLEHAILSHHGELEWGSPKRPSTIEALLLHHADNLDAKATGFSSALAGASRAEEAWTDATNLFRRPLYAPRAAEDDRPARAVEDAQYFRASA